MRKNDLDLSVLLISVSPSRHGWLVAHLIVQGLINHLPLLQPHCCIFHVLGVQAREIVLHPLHFDAVGEIFVCLSLMAYPSAVQTLCSLTDQVSNSIASIRSVLPSKFCVVHEMNILVPPHHVKQHAFSAGKSSPTRYTGGVLLHGMSEFSSQDGDVH